MVSFEQKGDKAYKEIGMYGSFKEIKLIESVSEEVQTLDLLDKD